MSIPVSMDYETETMDLELIFDFDTDNEYDFEFDTVNEDTTEDSRYILPPATTTTLGGIIVGENLQITPEGVLSGTPGGGGPIVPATESTLGGIIVGDDLQITQTGVLSVIKANAVEQDNTHPITAAAVYTEVGNINALLATI